MRLLTATNFLFAGLAVGVLMQRGEYIFLLLFLGFLIILGQFTRVAGSFILGGVFALALLEVEPEQALVMVPIVEASNLIGRICQHYRGHFAGKRAIDLALANSAGPMRTYRCPAGNLLPSYASKNWESTASRTEQG